MVIVSILPLHFPQLASEVGDLGLAYQAFKIAISVDPNHAESYNNIGVLELRKEWACWGWGMALGMSGKTQFKRYHTYMHAYKERTIIDKTSNIVDNDDDHGNSNTYLSKTLPTDGL